MKKTQKTWEVTNLELQKELSNHEKTYKYITPKQAAKLLTDNDKDARDLLKLAEELRAHCYTDTKGP